ncbi:MAG: DUF4855 domain-containing protein [Bacteroidales bacterium]|nr:DUF4855 domain-containing protein [Bacteroidales bacterium]
MHRLAFILLSAIILLPAGCGRKDNTEESAAIPAIRINETRVISAFTASFEVNAVNAVTIEYGVSEDMPEIIETGTVSPVTVTLSVGGLKELSTYTLYARGIGPGGEKGNVTKIEFSTTKGPESIYPWESGRTAVPAFADISLVTMGWHNYNPPIWTEERFASHVSYDGKWLFDAFLCIDGWDPVRNLSYSLTPNRNSATQESWQDLMDAWLGEDGALKKLDAAISNAASSLGNPPSPRYVVMSVPDPIMFQNFGDRSSSTTYWGTVEERQLDFSNVQDQIAAYKWYIDQCRYRFSRLGLKHLELAGFYVLSEELHLSESFYRDLGLNFSATDTWNAQYKRWETILPAVSQYLHSCNEGLWWVPYCLAPGHRVWKELGLDMAFMQPNHYWDTSNQHPMSRSIATIKQYKMGIELEFEYSMVADVMKDGRMGPDGSGNMIFTSADIPELRDRLREYMDAYKDAGLYGVNPIAVYSGTDAWNQLATSSDAGDKEMFREICTFIQESPLK